MAAHAPILPAVTPSYTGLDWTGATVVNVASTDSINTKLATAVSTLQALGPGGKVDVLLEAGATWNEMVTLPNHGVKGGRIRIMTAGWSLAYPTRVTKALMTAQNAATILAPDFNNCIVVAQGARGYHIRGLRLTCSTTQAFPAFVNYTPLAGVATLADIAWSHSLTQCCIIGNAAGQTRRNGITGTAGMLEIAFNHVEHVNYDGEDYGTQGQAIAIPAGMGRLNIHDNFLYRASEAIAIGGSAQYGPLASEGLVPCDITIKNNHVFVSLAMKGVELSANAFEAKEGRRILIEGNWIQNVWKDGQSGYAFVFWSANQGGEPWVHMCDLTIRYNVSILTNCGFSLGSHADLVLYGPSILPRRTHIHDNLFIGYGTSDTYAPDSSTVSLYALPEPGHDDISMHNNTAVSPNSVFVVLAEAAAYNNLEIFDNVFGNTGCTIFDTSSGAGDASWPGVNVNGNCRFDGNVGIGAGMPNGASNFSPADVASIGFADASKAQLATFAYTDLDAMVISGTYAGKGCDITALKAALPSTVITANADLPS